MLVAVAFLINLYLFPTGRRLFALEQVLKRALALGYSRIAQHITLAIEHDRYTQSLELRARAAPSFSYGPAVQALDGEVDHSVMGLHALFGSQIRLYGPRSRRGLAAAALRRELFPDGPNVIITLAYVQQHQAVRALLARLADADLADAVAALPDLVEASARIRELNDRYGQALADAQDGTAPTPEEVRAARARGQTLLAETVALIIAEFAGVVEEPRRDELLEPILAQNRAIRQARRRRRQPSDIDPDTGDVIVDDSPDAAQDGDPDSDMDGGIDDIAV